MRKLETVHKRLVKRVLFTEQLHQSSFVVIQKCLAFTENESIDVSFVYMTMFDFVSQGNEELKVFFDWLAQRSVLLDTCTEFPRFSLAIYEFVSAIFLFVVVAIPKRVVEMSMKQTRPGYYHQGDKCLAPKSGPRFIVDFYAQQR